ncbi:MAG: hypothetical protein H6626_11195 [Pseudobdellovibrionaceae bacterium]|nr:hypothetical protein [Bdellovibrionales bacterium]USN46765.1 MAG: hypothetical protein H6626_11195 [Pseudobdellovibrionaceae bacterium]
MLNIREKIKPSTLITGFLFSAVLIANLAVVLNGEWREAIYSWLNPPNTRKILATVTGDLFNDGSSVKVIKIRTANGLLLEVYGSSDTGARPLLGRINWPDPKDGYIYIEDRATNLALVDLNDDGVREIVAPSFDQKLTGHLNAYRFDPETKSFLLYQPQ